ncbi:MAG: RimK family protein [Alphaproteobacteria bacterium]
MTDTPMSAAPRPTITHIVIVNRVLGLIQPAKGRLVLTAKDYISGKFMTTYRVTRRTFVVNFCNNYGYLKTGYYCSLLADARDQFCIPAISDVIRSHWKRIHSSHFVDFQLALNDSEAVEALGGRMKIKSFFGRADHPNLEELTRKIFNIFRLPAVEIILLRQGGNLKIKSVTPIALHDLGADADAFNAAIDEFAGTKWDQNRSADKPEKYWLAILHDPNEEHAPSNAEALQNFIRIGKTMGFYIELITKNNFDSLLEFDALFIRETTAVNEHTYRFAEKAAREGLAVIDDPVSILRCCNKVYLDEMLRKNRISTPKSQLWYRGQKSIPVFPETQFPMVLKIPDGSFSRGVFKVSTQEELEKIAHEMFAKSEIILMQEFLRSDFDWRIVVLNGRPLFACKYFMAKSHWQIYNHASESDSYGNVEAVAIDQIPESVLATALKACEMIGDGLYGVDLKDVDGTVYVIEVNDNPNIDAGFEDQLLGDELYRSVLARFIEMIDA